MRAPPEVDHTQDADHRSHPHLQAGAQPRVRGLVRSPDQGRLQGRDADQAKHRLASLPEIDFADLLDEPFLALPASAGPLRDYWLATDHRGGRPVRVAMEVRNADETFEAIGNCAGIVLLSEGNAAIYHREGVTARPVRGLSPSELAVTWRTGDHRAVIRDFLDACRSVAATRDDNEKTA